MLVLFRMLPVPEYPIAQYTKERQASRKMARRASQANSVGGICAFTDVRSPRVRGNRRVKVHQRSSVRLPPRGALGHRKAAFTSGFISTMSDQIPTGIISAQQM